MTLVKVQLKAFEGCFEKSQQTQETRTNERRGLAEKSETGDVGYAVKTWKHMFILCIWGDNRKIHLRNTNASVWKLNTNYWT